MPGPAFHGGDRPLKKVRDGDDGLRICLLHFDCEVKAEAAYQCAS